eukprot:2500228-Amphidinium_carterae.2
MSFSGSLNSNTRVCSRSKRRKHDCATRVLGRYPNSSRCCKHKRERGFVHKEEWHEWSVQFENYVVGVCGEDLRAVVGWPAGENVDVRRTRDAQTEV